MAGKWVVRLAETAQQDLDSIYIWTYEHFGPTQAEHYRRVILNTLKDLREGPHVIGATSHAELPSHLRVLHVARKGRRGRHYAVFDAPATGGIRVVRILHDSMDMRRHVPKEPD